MISIAKRSKLDEALVVDEADLLPPLNFTANILSPESIRLGWTKNASNNQFSSLYYIINVQQINNLNDATNTLQNRQVF